MSDKREKKTSVNTEQIFDVICLIASYVILFMIPQNISIFFYLIVGVSAFLFCIGFFRLGLSFDVPASSKKTALKLRGAAALIILFGFVLIILKQFSESSVIAGIMLLIESICLWRMGGSSKSFNEVTPEMQAVPGMKVPIEQLHRDFSDVETQLGYPWIGKVKSIEQDAIIYGPSEDGFVVYGYYLGAPGGRNTGQRRDAAGKGPFAESLCRNVYKVCGKRSSELENRYHIKRVL